MTAKPATIRISTLFKLVFILLVFGAGFYSGMEYLEWKIKDDIKTGTQEIMQKGLGNMKGLNLDGKQNQYFEDVMELNKKFCEKIFDKMDKE